MHTNAAFKMPWIILILVFPVLGLCMYFLFGNSFSSKVMAKRYEEINHELDQITVQNPLNYRGVRRKRFLLCQPNHGVDVRIVTPGIPNKKLIYQVTRSYYAGLVHNGIRIYPWLRTFQAVSE